MKRIIPILYYIFICVVANAQIQQGIVRTAGRSNHPGEVLSGVIIRVEGEHNAVASREDGTFTIRFNGVHEGDMYKISSVKKPNYEILDKSFIGRSLAFSSKVPITIVLLDKNEMEQERRMIAARFEKKYAENYEKRIKEIEEKYEQQVYSLEQKVAALEDADNLYEKIQSQMNEMVDYYLRTDYDVLDSIDREINTLIEHGQFDEAREKILSKGDVHERVQAVLNIQRHVAENENAIRQLQQQQAHLTLQAQSTTENLLKDLMNLYQIARSNFQIDTAQVLIEHMLAIAPTDLDVLVEAASFESIDRSNFLKALDYSKRHLVLAPMQYPDSSIEIFHSYNRVVVLYNMIYQLDSALHYAQKQLSILENCTPVNYERIQYTYMELGDIYRKIQTDSAIFYCDRSREVLKLANIPDSTSRLAKLYRQYSMVYSSDSGSLQKAYFYNTKSLNLYKELNDSSNIADAYRQQIYIDQLSDSLDAAIKSSKKTLQYYPAKYVSAKVSVYCTMARIYSEQMQYDSALVCLDEALKLSSSRYSPHHSVSVQILMDRADVNCLLGNIAVAIRDYEKAIDYFETYYKDDPLRLYLYYQRRGAFFEKIGDNNRAIEDYKKALEYNMQCDLSAWNNQSLQAKIEKLLHSAK